VGDICDLKNSLVLILRRNEFSVLKKLAETSQIFYQQIQKMVGLFSLTNSRVSDSSFVED